MMKLVAPDRRRHSPGAILSGLVLGLILVFVLTISKDRIVDWYNESFPVIRGEAAFVSRSASDVVLELYGEKLRAECIYLRIKAYAKSAEGVMSDIFAQRIDQAETGDTKPAGKFYFGRWRFYPSDGAAAVVVFVQHSCGGQLTSTKLAEVKTP